MERASTVTETSMNFAKVVVHGRVSTARERVGSPSGGHLAVKAEG